MSANLDNHTSKGWRMFPWVPDGVYDYLNFLTRFKVIDGMPKIVITKIWLDQGGPADEDPSLKLPWGSYPDFPPKPEKKP